MGSRNSSIQKEIGPDDYDLEKGEALIGFSTFRQAQAQKQNKTDSASPAKQRKKNKKTLVVCQQIKNVGKNKVVEEVTVEEDSDFEVKPVKKIKDINELELKIKNSDYHTLNLRGILRYKCGRSKHCTTMFLNKKELVNHIWHTHKKKFTCNECKKKFKSKEELKRHDHSKDFVLMGFLQKIPD